MGIGSLLLKAALFPAGAGAAVGATTGYLLSDRKHKLKRALEGAAVGGTIGAGVSALLPAVGAGTGMLAGALHTPAGEGKFPYMAGGGVVGSIAGELANASPIGMGVAGGATLGLLASKKNRVRNLLLGGAAGGAAGTAVQVGMSMRDPDVLAANARQKAAVDKLMKDAFGADNPE